MPRPPQPPAFARFGRARFEPRPVRECHALVHHRFEVPRVVGLAHRVPVRHLRGPHHVAPAQLHRVHADLPRGGVHQPLDGVDRLGPAGSAVRAGRRRVGEHAFDVHLDGVNVVHAGGHPRPDHELDDGARRRRVSAEVGERMHAQGEDPAVLVQRQRRLAREIAAMRGRQEFLHPLGGPLHGPLQVPCAIRGEDVLAVERRLHPEAAAHVADQHAHFLGRDAEHFAAHFVADARGRLAAHPQCQAVGGRVEDRQRRPRLDRRRYQALVDDVERHDVGRSSDRQRGGFGIAVTMLARDVAGRLRPHQRRAWRNGVLHVDDHRQRLVVDLQRLRRVTRLLARFGNDGDNGFADVACRAYGERVLRWRRGRRAVAPPEVGRLHQRLHARGHEVVTGHVQQHARHPGQGGRIDRLDPSVRIRRADKDEVRLVRQREIVGELVASSEKAVILDTAYGLAAAEAAVGGFCGHDGTLLFDGKMQRNCRPQPSHNPQYNRPPSQ